MKAQPEQAAGSHNRCSFGDTQLRVGDAMFIELPRMLEKRRGTITLVGWLEGHSLIVTTPQDDVIRQALKAGEDILLRTFSGRTAYALRSAVMKTVQAPVQHLYLDYPAWVDCVTIRNSVRCRVDIPARILIGDAEQDCTIRNLSAQGAAIDIDIPLQLGDPIAKIAWSFELQGVPVEMQLAAVVRRIKASSDPTGGKFGLEFRDLKASEKLALVGFVTSQVLENRANSI
jgi:hypothetical protein